MIQVANMYSWRGWKVPEESVLRLAQPTHNHGSEGYCSAERWVLTLTPSRSIIMKFLTASSERNLVLSGPTWGASGDPYLVGSLVTSGTRERRRASGGIT